MNQKVMFIFNPHAGKGAIKNSLFLIIDLFFQQNALMTVFPTQYPNHAKELIHTYIDQYDLLLCSGGDGTLNEIIQAIMEKKSKIPLAYIPSGTVNDFANTLQLPSNPTKAIQQFLQHRIFACDICQFNQRYFTYIAAFGAFCDVPYKTSQTSKNTFGRIAYFLEGMKQISQIHSYKMRITYPHDVIEDEFIFGAISNSKSIAGFSAISTKNAQLDDGEFEVLLIKKPNNPLDLQATISALLHQQLDLKHMLFFTTNQLIIENLDEAHFTLDGEAGGCPKNIQIQICHKAINFLI